MSQPVRLSLEDKWTAEEQAELVYSMGRWEKASRHRVQFLVSPVLFHDPDGFDRDDLTDGVNVIYKIDAPDEIDFLPPSLQGSEVLGYNFDNADILIIWFRLYGMLNPTATHELGHHLGLGHVRTHRAVMNDIVNESCITQWDMEAFCSLYECGVEETDPECVVP